MSRFTDEESFDEYFYGLNDPTREIEELADWRNFQMRVVSKFLQQIRLIVLGKSCQHR
jgi:hypothetical protein